MVALAVLPCFAGEVAVLKNGFSIRHERRQVIGDVTRLFVNADGSSFVDVPTTEIEHFETVEDPPPLDSGPPASGINTVHQRSGLTAGGFPGRPPTSLNDVVDEASGRYRLDPDLVNSVIKAESAFNPRAVSPKGAQGLMQLMPGTASALGVPNAFDPQANVEGGAKYLRELLERYNFDLRKALAAYNAGPEKVERFGGIPPYYETRSYVARVVKDFNRKKDAQEKAATAARKSPLLAKPARSGAPTAARKATAQVPTAKPGTGVAVQAKAASQNQ